MKAAAAKSEPAAKKGDDENEPPLSEEGITPNHITMVMEHANCTRREAILALRETKDDMINAVM